MLELPGDGLDPVIVVGPAGHPQRWPGLVQVVLEDPASLLLPHAFNPPLPRLLPLLRLSELHVPIVLEEGVVHLQRVPLLAF
jgi:hypothetical protein